MRRIERPPYVAEHVDRNGKRRRYFRKAGQPRLPLPSDCEYGDPGFLRAYADALEGIDYRKPKLTLLEGGGESQDDDEFESVDHFETRRRSIVHEDGVDYMQLHLSTNDGEFEEEEYLMLRIAIDVGDGASLKQLQRDGLLKARRVLRAQLHLTSD